jgi:Chaperone of endosialidase
MSSQQQTQTQQSAVTNPYAPSIPLLTNDASIAGGINTAETPAQEAALQALQTESSAIPDISQPATGAVLNNLNANTSGTQGMLGSEVSNYLNNTNPLATNTDLNPYDTPGFAQGIAAMNTGIGQNITSQFAGAGRDPSGNAAASKAIALGEAQADAPVVASQYNSNVQNLENANAGQSSAVNSGASGISSEQLATLAQQLQGLTGGASLPGILTQPGQTELTTANTAYGTPWTNLSPSLAAAGQIGGMGGTSSGTGTSTTTSPAITNILGLLTGAAGIAGAVAKSDARLKENIKHVGDLHDGQRVHQFNWKDDPKKTPHIGLLAQEVERVRPDAVHELRGVKHVDYAKATENSRRIGMLQVAA